MSVASLVSVLSLLLWLLAERIVHGAYRPWSSGAFVLLSLLACVLQWRALRRTSATERAAELATLSAVGLVAMGELAYVAFALRAEPLESRGALAGALVPAALGALTLAAGMGVRMRAPMDTWRIAARMRSAMGGALLLVACFVLNLWVSEHDVRLDLSYRRVSEPSLHVRELLARVEEPLEITLLYEPHNEVAEAAQPYFAALGRGSKRVQVRVEDAAAVSELAQAARVRGNGHVVFALGRGSLRRYDSFLLGRELSSARSVLRTLDAHVAHHLSALLVPAKHVYLTYGHGERSVSGDAAEPQLARLFDLDVLLARFHVRTHRLGLVEGLGQDVPQDASAVLVLGPRRPFLAEERESLRRYLARGGRLWLGLEPLLDAGLAPLLDELGVVLDGSVLACTESHLVRTRRALDRELVVTRELVRHPDLSLEGARRAELSAVLVRATAVSLRALPGTTRADIVLRSGTDCFVDRDGDRQPSATEQRGTFGLIALARPHGGGRAVVIGDADFVTDQVLRNDANTFITLDLLRFLLGNDAVRPDVVANEDLPVEHRKEHERPWFYLTTFALPFLALLGAWWRARSSASGRAPYSRVVASSTPSHERHTEGGGAPREIGHERSNDALR